MNQKEFTKRRRQLTRMMESDSIAIVPAASPKLRNGDADYPYRQDSDFYYLTGFAEPDSVMVLVPGRGHAEYILFCRDRDPKAEAWDGPRAGTDGAVEEFGADDAFPIADINEILPGLMEGKERVYYNVGRNPDFDRKIMSWVNSIRAKIKNGAHVPGEFVSLDYLLHDMRLYKSRAEITAMRKAARISAEAHRRAMMECEPGMQEYELEALFLHTFRSHQAYPAYNSIVGGGPNACILHYTSNSDTLEDGELVLIDAGCEYDFYASDITRTFPVNGRFSKEQRAIYDVVLKAQKAAIDKIKPGNHWNEPHEAAVRAVTSGLIKLGILKGTQRQRIKDESYQKFFIHRTGHWIGMDVHDVGDYKVGDEWRVLEPGMVGTVEPGIYIPTGSRGVAKKWWGIGVRIEDDVLVTRDGHDVLSKDIPKEVDEIEALMAGGLPFRRSRRKAA
ncbi:MAG: Xaa-Pro aminopeptidase [Gammaproteobacteria bacterium]|nr:MAG: Xaa-Pro aminopeptidase [Gammaproteobacteria bacterium]